MKKIIGIGGLSIIAFLFFAGQAYKYGLWYAVGEVAFIAVILVLVGWAFE